MPSSVLTLTSFSVLVVLVVLLWQPDGGADAAKLRLCGKKLISVLQKLCNHKYRRPSPERLSYFAYEYAANRRSRGGIADNCCVNKCTYRHMKSYCAVTPTPTTPVDVRQTGPSPQSDETSTGQRRRRWQPNETDAVASVYTSGRRRLQPQLLRMLTVVNGLLEPLPSLFTLSAEPQQRNDTSE